MKSKVLPSLLLLATLSLQLQNLRADEPVMVDTSLRSIGIAVSIPELQAGIPAASDSFDVVRFVHSPAVDYLGPQEVTFYPAGALIEEGHPPPVPMASVTLNPEWKKTLLVWVGLGENRYGILAMPDDAFAFPQDHVRFVNLTPNRIGIITSEREGKITLPKNDWIIDANGREAIYFRAIMEDPEAESITLSNVVEMQPNVRRTVIFAVSKAGEMGGDPESLPKFSYFILTERQAETRRP
jgi:hypothetical protein